MCVCNDKKQKTTLFPAFWRVVAAPWFNIGTHGHWTQNQDQWQPRTVTHAYEASLEMRLHCAGPTDEGAMSCPTTLHRILGLATLDAATSARQPHRRPTPVCESSQPHAPKPWVWRVWAWLSHLLQTFAARFQVSSPVSSFAHFLALKICVKH